MTDIDNDNNDDNNKLDNEALIDEVPDINQISTKKKLKKKIIIIIIISIILVLAIISTLVYFFIIVSQIPISEEYYFDPNEEIKNYTINKNDIKLGIISDFQLDNSNENYERNLKNTLKKIKDENVDIIIIAGDIVDTGYPSEYEQYKRILNSIYTNNNSKPLIFEIMGNHEYYTSRFKKLGSTI